MTDADALLPGEGQFGRVISTGCWIPLYFAIIVRVSRITAFETEIFPSK